MQQVRLFFHNKAHFHSELSFFAMLLQRLSTLSILTDKIVLVVQSSRVFIPPSTGSLVSV
jgi:hypothetical protein